MRAGRLPTLMLVVAAAACRDADAGARSAPPPVETSPAPTASNVTASTTGSASPPPAASVAAPPPAPAETAPVDDGRPKLYARSRFAWIAPEPGSTRAWVGYAAFSGAVPLKGTPDEARAKGAGGPACKAWYRVEPIGWMCDGRDATFDANDPQVATLRAYAPDIQSPWPYNYAESIEAPRYPTLPTEKEQRRTEPAFDEHVEKVARARAAKTDEERAAIDKLLLGVDLEPAGVPAPELVDLGPFVRESRRRIARFSTIGYTKTFDGEGRTWLYTSDHAWIPKDKTKPYPRSTFQGIKLDDGVQLPIAFFRKKARPKYEKNDAGGFEPTGESWPVRTWVALTGEHADVDVPGADKPQRFWATREAGIWTAASDATVVRTSTKVPKPTNPSPRQTWVEISVLGGWLIAYEAERPVFATLVSPGRGGVPAVGKDPLETASTPLGTYRVDGKFRTATMVSSTDENIVHSDVMYILNFSGPHAIHGAYWHDEWGEPKSGGCVNLSPIDSKWLFDWTEPAMPEGWHGLRSTRELGQATLVVVHR